MFLSSSFLLTLAADERVTTQRTVFEYIKAGGPVGAILILLSIAGLTLIIIHMIQVRLSAMAPRDVVEQLERRLREGDAQNALAYCKQADTQCFLTAVFGSALTRCTRSAFGFLEIRNALEDSGHREVERLSRVTDGIGLIAAVGPMLGLLGTVFGMIGAFSSISELEGAARSRELAGYMSLALVTTAMGLAVAIPCTVAFSICRRRVERISGEVADIAEGLAAYLEQRPAGERQPARPAAQAAAPAPAARSAPPPRLPIEPVRGGAQA